MQFTAFDEATEVSGRVVHSAINALKVGADVRTELLAQHGVKDPDPRSWYPQVGFLKALEALREQCGNSMLFTIGKAIPRNVNFGDSGNLDLALGSIQLEYVKNHRNGEIGSYTVTGFDAAQRIATMKCHNPYPSHFNRRLLFSLAERYQPDDSSICSVQLDRDSETRLDGAESCTFIVRW